jgi:hypothetical protein
LERTLDEADPKEKMKWAFKVQFCAVSKLLKLFNKDDN